MEFKVIALSVGGSKNKVFKLGDIVTENQFPKGNAEILVAKGFLELVKKEEKKASEPEKKPLTDFNPNAKVSGEKSGKKK